MTAYSAAVDLAHYRQQQRMLTEALARVSSHLRTRPGSDDIFIEKNTGKPFKRWWIDPSSEEQQCDLAALIVQTKSVSQRLDYAAMQRREPSLFALCQNVTTTQIFTPTGIELSPAKPFDTAEMLRRDPLTIARGVQQIRAELAVVEKNIELPRHELMELCREYGYLDEAAVRGQITITLPEGVSFVVKVKTQKDSRNLAWMLAEPWPAECVQPFIKRSVSEYGSGKLSSVQVRSWPR